jgi:cytochrome oxidase Cu insertion factor (SCO1/SenC/PrrC family)
VGRRYLALTLGLAILVAVAGLAAWRVHAWLSAMPSAAVSLERLDRYGRVPPFSLTERSGRWISRDDLLGHVAVIDFIYTECTESCPTQSLLLARLQTEFADAPDLRLVSLTVDPRHDTPEVLDRYAARYGAGDRWWFLTGDQHDIYCLAKDGFHLGVVDSAATQPPACGAAWRFGPAPAGASHGSKGLIMHSARLVLVDRAAEIRAYHLATDPESLPNLKANLRRLLAERS